MIRSHSQLAEFIAGKRILHLNSLGKDSAVCLEWLATYAHPSKVYSVFFRPLAIHPEDDRYLSYQRSRYPGVEFLEEPNAHELTNIMRGRFQPPLDVLLEFNWCEYELFLFSDYAEEMRKRLDCDYISIGFGAYESVTRAMQLHKKGLVDGVKIYPIGLMKKPQILSIIRRSGLRIHPVYRVSKTTFDRPSYYKMRAAFRLTPEYWNTMLSVFPLLVLDKYRYEVLL